MVGLKRRPFNIALVALAAAFMYYSFNLALVSDTTAKIQGKGMGFCGFVTMLFSLLSLVCFMNAFQYRKKVNIPMLVLMLVMIACMIYADWYYSRCIITAITRAENPIKITGQTIYIVQANNMVANHIGILYVAVALVALLPVYSKLIRKVNTNVEVEDNGSMGAIDISGES